MELSQIGCMVGCVFQDPRSQFFMTDPFSEAAFGCSNMLLNREEILKRVDNSLKLLGINHLKEKSIFKLSSGEKQKNRFLTGLNAPGFFWCAILNQKVC